MTPDFNGYRVVIFAMSGGKDSLEGYLKYLDAGGDPAKVEFHHHEVDGREGSTLMDWPVTPAYCRALAKHFSVPIFFSWKVGGFEREMLRSGTPTAPTRFEVPTPGRLGDPDVFEREVGGHGPAGTRLKYPQVSADLSVRWCSSYLKVDVCAASIRNQARFDHSKTLVVTGERGEESTARAKYKHFEPHRADGRTGGKRRHVDHWRPLIEVTEKEVWADIERYRINVHPAYRLGWGRVSCMRCIFSSPDQWASARAVDPAGFERVARYEHDFGVTIQRKLNVVQLADRGRAYEMDPKDVAAAMSRTFDESITMDPWVLPRGAFGDSCGPT